MEQTENNKMYHVCSIKHLKELIATAEAKSKKSHNGKTRDYSTIILYFEFAGDEWKGQLKLVKVM